jgi:plasmid stabilization system protein ParE
VDYRLLYTHRALNDLAEIIDLVAGHDADVASRFGGGLLDHVDLLARFPRMGPIIRKRSQVRKLVHSPVLVYYQVHDNKRLVEVLHIRHGVRKAPKSELGSKRG